MSDLSLPDGVTWIERPDDPRTRDFLDLTDVALRRVLEPAEGLYLAESEKVIRRALQAGHRMRGLLLTPRWLEPMADLVSTAVAGGAGVFVASPEVSTAMTGFHLHRGALASMHRPAARPVAEVLRGARRVAVLEDIVDHTNVGAIFRAAAGLGMDAVLVTPRCADPLYRRSVRVSMGTVFQVPWTRIDPWPGGIDLIRSTGFTVAAMALAPDALDIRSYATSLRPDQRLAVVLGTEGDGLAPATTAAVDVRLRIPMAGGVDSLNVAAAAAVAFHTVQ